MADRLYWFELRVPDHGALGPFTAPDAEGYVIGRSDDASDYLPDIDLAEYEARDHGVSRRHVAIVAFGDRPHILDLNSVNGTYLNGRKIGPDEPHPIADGDELRLGTLVMQVAAVHHAD